jgi:hypothetical protein
VAPLAVSVVLLPLQMAEDPATAVTVGFVLTVTVTCAVFLHPFASVPVTVYVVVPAGVAVTVVPVVADNPVAGLQV